MGRSVLKDVDLETMYSMRREGMNNADIANALGVSKSTVINLIGPQPKELHKKRGGYHPRKAVSEPAEEEHEACLVVETRLIDLAGTCFCYKIDTRDRQVAVRGNDGTCIYVDVDNLGNFIKELSAIKRKMEGERMTNEMW